MLIAVPIPPTYYSRMTEFGRRLKQARKHRHLTQVELADGIGVVQSTIGAAERHGEGSRYTTQIASFLRVSPTWLAIGQGGMLDGIEEEQDALGTQPAARLDDDRVYDAIRWFADQIRDRQRRRAALAKCVNVMNLAFLEEQAQVDAPDAPQQAQSIAMPTPAPAVGQ